MVTSKRSSEDEDFVVVSRKTTADVLAEQEAKRAEAEAVESERVRKKREDMELKLRGDSHGERSRLQILFNQCR